MRDVLRGTSLFLVSSHIFLDCAVPFAMKDGGHLAPWLRPSGLPSVGLEPGHTRIPAGMEMNDNPLICEGVFFYAT